MKRVGVIRRVCLMGAIVIVTTICVVRGGRAQEGDLAAASPLQPTTIANPRIAIEHLELLVKPLTKEELVVEADAWRDLVKANSQKIAKLRMAVSKQNEVLEETQESKQAVDDSPAGTPDETAVAPEEAADNAQALKTEDEAAKQRKQEWVRTLPELLEDKSLLSERMLVVVNALERKGGDVEAYRQYLAALAGVPIDLFDGSTFWTVLKGWLVSEPGGQRWFWNIVKFLVILIGFYFGASIAANATRHAALRVQGASKLLVAFLGRFVKQAVMLVGLVVALAALEVNIAPLLAAVGAAGFVVAFALQDTLSNFASGMLILAYRPFDVGHVIDAAGVSGIVDSVSLFSTHIRTFDNKMMIVPNNDIWGGTITNASASATRRVDMVFGIGYSDDIEQAKGILESLVREHALVLDHPEYLIQLNELADSSVNFICRPWVKTEDYWTVYWDITRSVKEAFDRNGISIPFPQQDVHIHRASTTE